MGDPCDHSRSSIFSSSSDTREFSSEHKQTSRTCDNILDMQTSLWRFFEIKGVSPTNNHAERQLRPLVISKKLTFGTQSERSIRFIEQIFTVAMSCRQQKRDVLAFLITDLQKYFSHQPPPSLIPT